jgi:cytochrome c oxidase assembly factor CtaG
MLRCGAVRVVTVLNASRTKGVITPPIPTFLTTFHFDPIALGVIVIAAIAYAIGIVSARRRGVRWSLWPTLGFYVLGLGFYAWVSFGFLGAYTYELRWAYITRIAFMLFAVPWLLALGKPAALADSALTGRASLTFHRFLNSKFLRLIGNAVFEPLFTVALFMLFVTPLSAWLRVSPIPQNAATILIPLFGLLTIIPIAEDTRKHTSFFLTVEFMLAMGALIFDAVPGILLRLHNTVLDGIPSVAGNLPSWFPYAIRDQHLAGDFIWLIAEVADIPVIIILFLRWARIDRGEAVEIDELSDEEMEALTQEHLNRWQQQ